MWCFASNKNNVRGYPVTVEEKTGIHKVTVMLSYWSADEAETACRCYLPLIFFVLFNTMI